MNAKVMQIDRPQMTMRTKLGTLAMAVVAAMTLGGAEPAFAHGPNNPRVEGPDKRWHWNMYHVPNQGAERLHDRSMLLCSKVGSLIIVPPEVGAEWAAGERIWWRYWLYKWDAATGWQPVQGFGPSGWREYGRDPSDNRWFKGANENLSVAPGYYHAQFDVYWSTHGASAHMHAEQYWQGTNNANWARVPSNPYCET